MNVRSVDSNLMHKFSYLWYLKDIEKAERKRGKVFSFFSCGGGSSMGYKLAGFDVIGNCEIDPKINKIYVRNNHPIYNYEMDIRDFLKIPDVELPKDLYNLDILDGSPPCSTFSMAGSRENAWGKEKVFREGQAAQTLDDLFFYYIQAVQKLKPKVFVAENVKGLLLGNAKGYVNEIIRTLDSIGYTVQIFLLNSASMGVPQLRERVFFVGHRKELEFNKLSLVFDEKPILYGEFADKGGEKINPDTQTYKRWQQRSYKEKSIGDTVKKREDGKISGFTTNYLKLNEVPRTLTAGSRPLRFDKPTYISDDDVKKISSFPMDYDFNGVDPCYVCGMSVPPVMMAQIASQVYEQWLKKDGCLNDSNSNGE